MEAEESASSSFSIDEATIEDIQQAFQQNSLTCREVVNYYLDAINSDPKKTLSAVIEVNPNAVSEATKFDENLKLINPCKSGLEGIPILLKDNIATKDKLNTTAGSFALLGSVVPRDAGVVDRLRKAGAIILGKAGLSEWANFRGEGIPNGWSARGGTVKNPYNVEEDPGGSSTGSAVAVAANLVTVSLGTETNRSIIEPCSVNCVVGIKPTLGLTSRSGVIPLTHRQDTVGPIGRTVADAVTLLDVIVGYDPRDSVATKAAAQYIPPGGYKQFLNKDGLKGKKLGNLWSTFKNAGFDPHTSPVPGIYQKHIETMRQLGAIIIDDVEIANFFTIMDGDDEFLAMQYEFKVDLNAYLSKLVESPVRTLADVIAYNEKHPEQEMLETYNQNTFIKSEKTNMPSKDYTDALDSLKTLREEGFEKFMNDNNLDAMVAPGHLAAGVLANGGYPCIIVPGGFDEYDVPVGILFGGLKGSEPKLIEIAYAFEQATKFSSFYCKNVKDLGQKSSHLHTLLYSRPSDCRPPWFFFFWISLKAELKVAEFPSNEEISKLESFLLRWSSPKYKACYLCSFIYKRQQHSRCHKLKKEEMEKKVVLLQVLFFLCLFTVPIDAEGNWREKLNLGEEKTTQLHFFFHDIQSGKNPSAIKVAEGAASSISPTMFGTVMMADDPLTEGPEPTSKIVGHAQGLYGSAGQQELGLIMAMSFCFSEGEYNGSTLSLMGRNSAMHPVREMPIVGGTGMFQLARGVAVARTYWLNVTSGDAIVEYNVTAIHYESLHSHLVAKL
ncbi:hypothetical protein Sjap_009982 [Stephania japonica]|uniref:Amidase domain-containing protein n=1 Tax=Stephania japonica TaxID=461633 RepID=A0AAP0JAB3_9MAGN